MGIDAETYAAAKGYTDKMVEGGGGTLDYEALRNHPSINGNELVGNKSSKQLGMQNLFTGTTAEWAQLTADQKAQYTHVCFTDDTAQEVTVVANPEAQATAELTKLQVGQGVYSVPSGSQVAANTSAIEAIVNEYGSKNLLPFDLATMKVLNTSGTWNGNVYTLSGVSFTIDTVNKTVTLDGTSTAEISFLFVNSLANLTVGTNYIFSSENNNASTTTFLINIPSGGSGKEFQFEYSADNIYARIVVRNGVTLNNEVIKPMIRDARITDPTYVPYAMTNRELTDEVNEVKSGLADLNTKETITLTAEEGVTLENVDITKIGNVVIGSFRITLASEVALYGVLARLSVSVAEKAAYPTTGGYVLYSDKNSSSIRTWQNLPAGSYVVQLVFFVTN